MSVILESEFATAEDTAAALGVSDARLKRLMRLAGPEASARRLSTTARHRAKSNGTQISFAGRASRKKQPRGKTKKAAH